jgi:hypothetical protein
MMFVDFQHAGRPVVRCLFVVGSGSGGRLFICERNCGETPRPRADGRLCSLVGCAKVGKSEGVHIVHTMGFGSGRTGAGLGRIAEVCGGVAEVQGLEPGSSPTSGTVFPQVSGFLGFCSCAHCAHSRL